MRREKALRQKNSFGYARAHMHGDLTALSAKHSPHSSEWTNSVAICAIAKNENTTDIREWVLYHRCVVVPTQVRVPICNGVGTRS